MKNTYFIIYILFFIFSCNTKTKVELDTLCDNQKYLLAPNKDLPTFNFDLNVNPREHIQVLKDSFSFKDLCDKQISINNVFDKRIINVNTTPICNLIAHFKYESIYINLKNEILFDDLGIIDIESIPEKINLYFPFKYNTWNIVRLEWEYGLSKPLINDVIYQISEGYLKALERISIKKINKPICELSLDQIKNLKEEYPIIIELRTISLQIEDDYTKLEILNSN